MMAAIENTRGLYPQHRWWRSLRPLVLALLGLSIQRTPLWAATPVPATTSRAARNEAVQAIPFDQLNEPTQAKVWDVVSKPSMYRRMPVEAIDCDADLYLFLVRYPEVVVNIWDVMGVTKVAVRRTGEYALTASDGAGTLSNVELVYGTRDTHLFYATGKYEGRLTKRPVTARCVLLLKSGYTKTGNGRTIVTNRLDLFIRFDNAGADILAKTLHPLVGRTADFNFKASIGFLSRVSHAAETNSYGVKRLAARLTKVDPAVRRRFAELSGKVQKNTAARLSSAANSRVAQPVLTAHH